MYDNKFALVTACVDLLNNPSAVNRRLEKQFSEGGAITTPDQAIREAFFKLMGTDKPDVYDIRRNSAAIFEILERVLTETALKGVQEEEFFMRFAEVSNLARGDKQSFYVKDDAVVIVSKHSGNHWNIHRQKMEGGTSFTVETEVFAAAIYGDFEDFLTGRVDFGEMVDKVSKGIQLKINSEVAAAFASAGAQLPSQFQATGAYDEGTLMDLVAHVEAVAGSAMVVGSKRALSKITAGANYVNFTEGMKAELHNKGRVGQFNGMTLVELPAVHKANSFDFAYNDNQLLILPATDVKPIKLVFEGKSLVKDTTNNTDNMDMSYSYSFLTRIGTKVVFDTLYAVYNLN